MPIERETILKDTWAQKSNSEMRVAILAAGLGRRMDPLTAHHIPKPMFPLGGHVPMLELWVRRAVSSGITDVAMNLCVLSETIKAHFQDGAKFAADVSYVEEATPSGTLGGVCKLALGKRAKSVISGEQPPTIAPFKGNTLIVPSGDIVTNFSAGLLEEMYSIHRKNGAALSMVLTPIPDSKRGELGTVVLENEQQLSGTLPCAGRISEFREKDPNSPSNLNNASIYMIERELLEFLDPLRTAADPSLAEPFYDFGKHVFPAMLGQLEHIKLPRDFSLWGIQYDGLWFDVGRKRDYLQVNSSFLDGDFELEIPYEKLPWGYLGTNVTIDFSQVKIIPPVIIGHDAIIEPGAVLGPYAVIGDGWIVERNASIRSSVLWKRYDYFGETSSMSASARKMIDRHQVRSGVTVDSSIVVGGTIESDLFEKTVDVLEDGRTEILDLDYLPSGPRA